MIKRFVLCFLILVIGNVVLALEIVYPKKNGVVINSDASFFVGSANPDKKLSVNGDAVEIHPSGGFVFPIKLNYGINKFNIKSGEELIEFNIIRKVISPDTAVNNTLKEYDKPKYAQTKKEISVLRSSPIDWGINRIAHLPVKTELIMDGEQNDFYRIILGENKKGWILKSDIEEKSATTGEAEFFGMDYSDTKDYYMYTIYLSKRVPWEVREADGLSLYVFNLKDFKHKTFRLDIQKNIIFFGKNLLGYSAEYRGNDLIFKIRKPIKINPKKPLKGIPIVIDAGHGGTEIGTTGCLGDKEKDINLKYAFSLQKELESRGADVIMTRTDDSAVSLSQRVNITKQNDAVLFISLHGNALPDNVDPRNVRGCEIYYYYNQAKPLATTIMHEIEKIPDTINHGIIQQSFAVVRNSNAISLLIEVGYMINPTDNELIISEGYRQKMTKAIADGIEKYFYALK